MQILVDRIIFTTLVLIYHMPLMSGLFSLLSNYSWKLSDDPSVPEYEDFIGGLVAGFNYSF